MFEHKLSVAYTFHWSS